MARLMRAAQYDKDKNLVLVHSIPIPQPQRGEILVKVAAASLCHSDLMTSMRPSGLKRPLTIGHEGVGTIAQIHPSVQDKGLRVGDRIGMFYIVDCCFECEGCRIHGTFCSRPPPPSSASSSSSSSSPPSSSQRRRGEEEGGGSGDDHHGPKIQGLQADGFFAEYAVTDWRNAIHLPKGLPIERMSPFFCAGVTAFHAVDKCSLQPNQWLAVVGCGGVGQLAIRYAKAMGLRVIALDINDDVLDLVQNKKQQQQQQQQSDNTAAGAAGAAPDAAFNPRTNPKFHQQIRRLTKSRGCNAAAVFSDSRAAYATAQKALGYGGVLMVVGMPDDGKQGSGGELQFSAVALSLGLMRVRGASNGTVAEVKRALDFTAKHGIVPDVEFRELDEMPRMWEEMRLGRAKRRMVVRFGEGKSKL